MNVPLVRRFDLQLAGRYEHYSDFGSVARPKIAAAWDVFDGLRVRGSYSQGFRAPNLEHFYAVEYARLATVRKRVVQGKSVYVRVDPGRSRILEKKNII